MRLLYILVDDLEPSAEELGRLTAGGQAAVGPHSTFTVEPIEVGPHTYYESAVGLAMCVPGVLRKLIDRQDDFDAALLGCFGDPGLRAARTVARIPVIGAAEAATALAQLVAQRYGIATIEHTDIPEMELYLSTLEVRHKCVGVDAVGLPFYALVRDTDDTLRRLEEAGRRLMERGAEAILLGCMSFGFYPFAARLQERLGVPVIDPLRAGVAAAKSMISLGVLPSRRNLPALDDPSALVAWLRALSDQPQLAGRPG
jgi:allantoin racemase